MHEQLQHDSSDLPRNVMFMLKLVMRYLLKATVLFSLQNLLEQRLQREWGCGRKTDVIACLRCYITCCITFYTCYITCYTTYFAPELMLPYLLVMQLQRSLLSLLHFPPPPSAQMTLKLC